MVKRKVFRNIGELLTLEGVAHKDGRRIVEEDLSIIKKAAFVVEDGKFIWIGEDKKIPKIFFKGANEYDLKKKTVMPGLIECHTHTIFAGSRADEFELRNQGVSYQEIAARGGGIISTTKATRSASPQVLANETLQKIDRFIQQGVTTLEIKSGYALDLKNEVKVLEVIQKLQKNNLEASKKLNKKDSEKKSRIQLVPTYLGAHALPKEFENTKEYTQYIIQNVFPILKKKKLTERVDIFVEKGFFTEEIGREYLQAAKEMGFQTVIHADQLSLSGGSRLAVELKSLSADHVIQISQNEIDLLANSDVTAVLLPAADLYMKCAYPPARQLIDRGARVALATDYNPGSCPTQDISLVGLLARLQMKMTLPEVIAAYTFNAASALRMNDKVGSIQPNKSAHFISSSSSWSEFFYSAGKSFCDEVFYDGDHIH